MSFIVLEGLDGSGGQTQTNLLKDFFEKNNTPFIIVRSPDYDNVVGQLFDDYLHGRVDLSTEQVFLLCAMDVLNSVPKIKQGLNEGKIVIADRYITSTLAYRDAAGFPLEKGLRLVKTLDFPKPNLIIFLDIHPEISIQRKFSEKKNLDLHEKNENYLRKVRESYKKGISKNVLGKWVVVNGEKTKEEVHEKILKLINPYLRNNSEKHEKKNIKR